MDTVEHRTTELDPHTASSIATGGIVGARGALTDALEAVDRPDGRQTAIDRLTVAIASALDARQGLVEDITPAAAPPDVTVPHDHAASWLRESSDVSYQLRDALVKLAAGAHDGRLVVEDGDASDVLAAVGTAAHLLEELHADLADRGVTAHKRVGA